MSLTGQDLIMPCLLGGIVAFVVLIAQYQAYRYFGRREQNEDARGNRGPSVALVALLLLIMLLPVVPVSVNNDPRWPVVLYGIVAGSVWLLAGVLVSAIALIGSCCLLERVQGWPRCPRGRALVHSVLAVPATLGVVLLGFGVEASGQAGGSYGNAAPIAGLCLLALVALLTVLASKILPMNWENALLVTILHGFFAIVVVAAWTAWAVFPR